MVSVNNVGAFVPASSVDTPDHASPLNPITVDAPHNRQRRDWAWVDGVGTVTQGTVWNWGNINGNAQTDWAFVDKDSMLSRNFKGGIDYKVNPGGGSSALRSYNLTISSITWLLLNEQVKNNNDGGTGAVINGSNIQVNGGQFHEIRAIGRAFEDAQGIAQKILAYPGDYRENYAKYMDGFATGFYQPYAPGSYLAGYSGSDDPIVNDGFKDGRNLNQTRQNDGTIETLETPKTEPRMIGCG